MKRATCISPRGLIGAALATALLAPLAAAGADAPWPTPPDFKKPVDYLAWFKKLRGTTAGPAWDALAKIIPPGETAPDFGGPAAKPGESLPQAPWKPADHPDWEKAYQATRRQIAGYLKAGALPLGASIVVYNPGEPPLVRTTLPQLSHVRACAIGALHQAWRSRTGRPIASNLLAAIEGNLRWADQLDHGSFLIESLSASGVRAHTYAAIAAAIDQSIFSPADLERLANLLVAPVPSPAAFERNLKFEAAAFFDIAQTGTRPNAAGKFSFSDERTKLGLPTGPGHTEIKPADDVRQQLAACQRGAELLADGLSTEVIDQLKSEASFELSKDPLLAGAGIHYQRWLTLLLSTDAQRRGTRLAVALAAVRAESGRWPRALNDLDSAVLQQAGNDPWSGKPFVYKLRRGAPQLYSVGPNRTDDGGQPAKDAGGDLVILAAKPAAAVASGKPAQPGRVQDVALADLTREQVGQTVRVHATVFQAVEKPSKNREKIYIVTLADADTRVELVFWKDLADQLGDKMPRAGDTLTVTAEVTEFRGKVQLTLHDAAALKRDSAASE
ncbi:MAG: OB-fold nucleic acid binding domain-containing protein [Phycisphaerae bacterium]